jgi:hypothetical protein
LQIENIFYKVFQKKSDCSNATAKWEKTESTHTPTTKCFTLSKSAQFLLPFNNINDTLYFNNNIRPEVYLISENEKSRITFNYYPKNQNPLYYEMQLILPFYIENEKENLLCIVANCANKNFAVNNCSKFENNPDMQNTILLFTEK